MHRASPIPFSLLRLTNPRPRTVAGCSPWLARGSSTWVVISALVAVLLGPPSTAATAGFPVPPQLGPPAGFEVAETARVRFVVQEGAALDATTFAIAYGPAADAAIADLTALLPTPRLRIELYAYATEEGFAAVTREVARPEPMPHDLVVDPAIGDVAVALPRFLARSPLDAENGLRHALAHVVARRASGGTLPRGFDEGFALYAERPVSARQARHAALLQNAAGGDELLTWSDLNRPLAPTVDPALLEAHAYGIVAFLVERHGLRRFADYVEGLRADPDWRAGMRTAYQRPPSELEAQWRENIPAWAAGGWRDNQFAAFDLEPARDLLAKAHYAAAKTELERSLRLFTDIGDAQRRSDVEGLLREGDVGLQAEALMGQIQQALERHTYDRADSLATQARAQYEQLPPPRRPTALLETYAAMASEGLAATEQLATTRLLADRWADYPEARAAAVTASQSFARLGDGEEYEATRQELTELDGRQRRLVLTLGALAVLTVAWLALWLWARGPAELDWR